MGTRNTEESRACSVAGRNETRAIRWRRIDFEIQRRTGSDARRKGINDFESPSLNIDVRREEIGARGEMTRLRSWKRDKSASLQREAKRMTEEQMILLEITSRLESPLGEIGRRGVVRGSKDLPIDLQGTRTVQRTESEESDLSRWIQSLEFQVRITHRANDTTEKRSEVKLAKEREWTGVTRWQSVVWPFLLCEREDKRCLEEIDFVDVPESPAIGTFDWKEMRHSQSTLRIESSPSLRCISIVSIDRLRVRRRKVLDEKHSSVIYLFDGWNKERQEDQTRKQTDKKWSNEKRFDRNIRTSNPRRLVLLIKSSKEKELLRH